MTMTFKPGRFYQCCRCRESKDWHYFNDGQMYWNYWCIRCQKSPTGSLPIRQTEEHRRGT
ncbi:protein NinD [Rosenbergiella australiborealis]|uniref:protein NinD n=1 Tax=Rosenbergiella australiborealis TaxID=1544696 RepID=UPI0030B8E56A